MTNKIEVLSTEQRKKNIVQKAIEKIEKTDGCNSFIGTYEEEDFLVVESWEKKRILGSFLA